MGASGLGSHISIWLGPPRIQRMVTLRLAVAAWVVGEAWAWQRSTSASERPAAPAIPRCRKLRRESVALRSEQPSRGFQRVMAASSEAVTATDQTVLVHTPYWWGQSKGYSRREGSQAVAKRCQAKQVAKLRQKCFAAAAARTSGSGVRGA